MFRIESHLFIHFWIQYTFIELTLCQIVFCMLLPIQSTRFCGIYYIPLEKTDDKNVNKYMISGAIKKKQGIVTEC